MDSCGTYCSGIPIYKMTYPSHKGKLLLPESESRQARLINVIICPFYGLIFARKYSVQHTFVKTDFSQGTTYLKFC